MEKVPEKTEQEKIEKVNRIEMIIVAAGSGSRFGDDLPKQFCDLDGEPVLVHTIRQMQAACRQMQAACRQIQEGCREMPEGCRRMQVRISVVVAKAFRDYWEELSRRYDIADHRIVIGGATRWESVKNALEAIEDDARISLREGERNGAQDGARNGAQDGAQDDAVVLIHDGARPLVDVATVERVIRAAKEADGAIPAIPVTDSLRIVSADGRDSTAVDRKKFRAVQTPQGFTMGKLRAAYCRPYMESFTDDASVMADAGFTDIRMVEGNPDNIKITNRRDIAIAEAILRHQRTQS